jgi:hypothetical protein
MQHLSRKKIMTNKFHTPKSTSGLLLILIIVVLVGIYGFLSASGQSIGAIIGQNAAESARDETTVARVNGEPLTRGMLKGLANVIMAQEGKTEEQAYQSAFTYLVKNKLLQQEAAREGLLPSEQEVNDEVDRILENAREYPPIGESLMIQAEARGVNVESAEFREILSQSIVGMLAHGKLNEQLLNHAGGDRNKYNQLHDQLIHDLLSQSTIEILSADLPQGGEKNHVPSPEEIISSSQ